MYRFLATVVVLAAWPALACEPVPTTLDAQIAAADVIFEGTVVEIKQSTDITFEVNRYWKGQVGTQITVKTVNNTCGISGVTPGDHLLIFAKGNPLMTTSVDGDYLLQTASGQIVGDTKSIENALGMGRETH